MLDEAKVSHVNEFNFPDDFLWNSSTLDTAIIKGKKIFQGDLCMYFEM